MNGYSQRRLKMLRGTLVFGGTRGSGLPASGQKWLGVVTQSVAQIDLLSSGKTGGADSAHGGVVASGAAFEQMFKLMKRIHKTADAIDHDDDLPDIADAPLELPFVFEGPPPPPLPQVVARDQAGRVTIRAMRLTTPLRIDGALDEPFYARVPAISDFILTQKLATTRL